MARIYNLRPSDFDARDHHYSLVSPLRNNLIKTAVDLRSLAMPVRDQGDIGACAGFSTAGCLEIITCFAKGERVSLSPAYLYYNARKLEGTLPQDSGAQLRDLMKVVTHAGDVPEQDWPFSDQTYNREPPGLDNLALPFRAGAYHSLNSLADMLSCLSSGYPFVLGMAVPQAMERFTAASCLLDLNLANEPILGGHAVCAVGYDLLHQVLIIRNSWGSGWGSGGYFYLDMRAVPRFVFEAWVFHYGAPWQPKPARELHPTEERGPVAEVG